MAKRKSRKQQTYKATSIPIFSPEALKKASAPKKSGRKTTRKRKKPKQNTFLSGLVRSWGYSHYLAFLLIAVSLAGMAYLFTDSSFQTATPIISGPHYLDSNLILEQAHLDGQNIYIVDPTAVANRISTFMPQVKKVRIRLGLPNKVALTITEREPVMVYGRGNQTQWADDEGHLFAATTDIPTLPVLVDEDGSASSDGQHLNPAIWQAMQEIVAIIPEINQFHYQDVYGLFFISPEGWRVYLGDGENMQKKLVMWQTIRQQLLRDNRSVKAVDLRFDRVYIQ